MSSLESSKSVHGSGKPQKASVLRPKLPGNHLEGILVKEPRRKRVWKACERCKIKKIKCDAGGPCKRCKADGMVCVASSKRKTELASVPRGYAEVLENTHFALIATVEKLYSMLRNRESWELSDPEMNDHGKPIIHDVAKILGCIRESKDNDWAWPERADDISELKAKMSTAQQDHLDDKQDTFSGDYCLSLGGEGLRPRYQDSGTPFNSLEAATADPLVQREEWSLSQNPSSPEHQESPQEPDIILSDFLVQDTQVDVSNPYFFPMDSARCQFSELEIDMFDTRGATDPFASDLSTKVLDWTLWSDIFGLENGCRSTVAV